MKHAEFSFPVRRFSGYASRVSRLHGQNFALLGNAGGFIDPVFSSDVTIALKSASLAAGALARQLRGETVDWALAFAAPLGRCVAVFRPFVGALYDTRLQDTLVADSSHPRTRSLH